MIQCAVSGGFGRSTESKNRKEEHMKKKVYGAIAALFVMSMLGGCGAEQEKPLHQMDVDKYVTLGDYKSLNITAQPYEVDEEEWKEWLAGVYAGYASENFGTVERAVQKGDTANIDYEGKLDGVAFEGGTDQAFNLTIGSGQFIDGFEDGLIGVMPGETVDLPLKFPEGYGNTDLAGKEVVFTVKVNYVIPGNEEEMQDVVVEAMEMEAENVTTVAQLKQYLYELLEEEAQSNSRSDAQDMLMDALIEQCVFEELPEYMVESYKTTMTRNMEKSAEQYGVTVDAFTSYYYGMTCEQFVNTFVEDFVKQDLVLQAIANREGLTVEDEELDKTLQDYMVQGGYSSVEELMGENDREQYRNYFMNEKVFDFLLGTEQ